MKIIPILILTIILFVAPITHAQTDTGFSENDARQNLLLIIQGLQKLLSELIVQLEQQVKIEAQLDSSGFDSSFGVGSTTVIPEDVAPREPVEVFVEDKYTIEIKQTKVTQNTGGDDVYWFTAQPLLNGLKFNASEHYLYMDTGLYDPVRRNLADKPASYNFTPTEDGEHEISFSWGNITNVYKLYTGIKN